jgi:hypothetical protein
VEKIAAACLKRADLENKAKGQASIPFTLS